MSFNIAAVPSFKDFPSKIGLEKKASSGREKRMNVCSFRNSTRKKMSLPEVVRWQSTINESGDQREEKRNR